MSKSELDLTAEQIARKREKTRQWRLANPERNRAHSRASYYRRRKKCIAQVTAYFHANRAKVYAGQRRRERVKQEWLAAYKAERGCSRCPERDPICLDFHHRDGQKDGDKEVSLMLSHSLARIQREVAKCDVLCANCHRKHHAARKTGPWRKKT